LSKQANPDWWIAQNFVQSEDVCVICDVSDGEVRIVMDRPHHVECFQRFAETRNMGFRPTKRHKKTG
jgi:hypothetical protein